MTIAVAMQPLLLQPIATSLSDCRVRRIRSYRLAARLIRLWHSTLPNPPAGFRIAFLVESGDGLPVAVATWGRPVARLEEQETTLELTRLAHGPHAPRNLGSWALARMRREIRLALPEVTRLISYQDADAHDGALYKADNWRRVHERRAGHTWTNRPGRLGTERQHKVKWERTP